jgi:hypothetical protein
MRFFGKKLENNYGITCITICRLVWSHFSENSSQIKKPAANPEGGAGACAAAINVFQTGLRT